ncbi:MAG: hypothetical protein J0L97_00100 [Alphaproteobacteria bacterium]|nr:hypothetical protein [Alphaproteobacteria bacterium]
MTLLTISGIALLLSFAGTAILRKWLLRHAVVDTPNERSNHSGLIPRGAGIAVILSASLTTACALLIIPFADGDGALISTATAIALAVIFFFEDMRGLPILERVIVQAAAICIGISFLPGPVFGGFFQGWVDTLLAALLWLWFLNAVNFMDGIDGITGVETTSIAFGIIGLGFLHVAMPEGLTALAAALAGASVGFLFWNWHKAKIFLGDSGSIPLGYLLGYALLSLASSGAWAAALILPAYYFADAGFTLSCRMLRGEKPWKAHSEHAYQCAVRSGKSHALVSTEIAVANALLVALATAVTIQKIPGWVGVLIAYALVFGLMRCFYSPRGCARE